MVQVLVLEDDEGPEFFYLQLLTDDCGVVRGDIASCKSKAEALAVRGPLRAVLADLEVYSGNPGVVAKEWRYGLEAIEGLIGGHIVKADNVIVCSRYVASSPEIKTRLVQLGVDFQRNVFLRPVGSNTLAAAMKRILT